MNLNGPSGNTFCKFQCAMKFMMFNVQYEIENLDEHIDKVVIVQGWIKPSDKWDVRLGSIKFRICNIQIKIIFET